MVSDKDTKGQRCALVALIGRPNVGKSTLFNRITKSRKAIVDPSPGVTRDRHYERVIWNDRQFVLIDTGGIDRAHEQTMVDQIREQTLQAVQEADLILFVMDARDGLMPADYEVAELLRKSDKPVHYVVNKIDGPELESLLLPQFYELGVEKLLAVSAEHGFGVRTVLDKLINDLPATDAVHHRQPGLSDEAIRLVFLGRPNVGKSSLINRILGENRMVVSDIPGTTRDSVDTLLTRKNREYVLIDTAGIRRRGQVFSDRLEKFSVMRALASLERCDIALLLIDAEEGITDQDTKVIGYSQDSNRGCILVVNKWDLLKKDVNRQKHVLTEIEMATSFVGFAPMLTVSALTGYGVNRIFPLIEAVYRQYRQNFPTNRLNLLLQEATASHPPPMHKGKKINFFYTTQISTSPPTFAVVANYPKGVHFSYHRYLTNRFRKGLGLDKSPLRIVFRERKRKKYG